MKFEYNQNILNNILILFYEVDLYLVSSQQLERGIKSRICFEHLEEQHIYYSLDAVDNFVSSVSRRVDLVEVTVIGKSLDTNEITRVTILEKECFNRLDKLQLLKDQRTKYDI